MKNGLNAPKNDESIIRFYKVKDEYGCFSNFSPHGFELDNQYWPTSEHYFQAQKFFDETIKEKIRRAETPMIAATIGRDRSLPLREDWDAVKEEIMKKALLAKFSNNAEIKSILLSTYPKTLIEATIDDYYWGCGKDNTGLNRLGYLLMEVRSIFIKNP